MPSQNYTMRRIVTKFKKGYSLVPSDIDRDTEIDYKSALSEMSDKFDALKKRWDANETELVNAFKILGYGKE